MRKLTGFKVLRVFLILYNVTHLNLNFDLRLKIPPPDVTFGASLASFKLKLFTSVDK